MGGLVSSAFAPTVSRSGSFRLWTALVLLPLAGLGVAALLLLEPRLRAQALRPQLTPAVETWEPLTPAPSLFSDATVVRSNASTSHGADLLLEEDFSTYRDTQELLKNPRGIYAPSEDMAKHRIVLDTALGYGESSRSMRYDFPALGCGNHTISRGILVPDNRREIWLEVVARFSADFSTEMARCRFAPAYKFVFGLLPGNGGRFDLVAGLFGRQWIGRYPGQDGAYKNIRSPFGAGFDGRWHVYRFHWKLSTTPQNFDGIYQLWMDERLVVNDHRARTRNRKGEGARKIWLIALGRNINNGPEREQSIWWGRVRIWGTDPGW